LKIGRQLNELAKSIRENLLFGCDFLPPKGLYIKLPQYRIARPFGEPAREQLYSLHTASNRMEVTRALAALQPLYGKGNIEIVTADGHRVRGIVRSMKTTHALSTPSVKVERADGEIVKIPFTSIIEIINHNHRTAVA